MWANSCSVTVVGQPPTFRPFWEIPVSFLNLTSYPVILSLKWQPPWGPITSLGASVSKCFGLLAKTLCISRLKVKGAQHLPVLQLNLPKEESRCPKCQRCPCWETWIMSPLCSRDTSHTLSWHLRVLLVSLKSSDPCFGPEHRTQLMTRQREWDLQRPTVLSVGSLRPFLF